MFQAHVLIIRRSKLHYTASGIITSIGVMILERKVLGYIHIRRGPNKVGFVGIFQTLEMLLSCLLGSNIFLWFLII